mgnify:CR=1 FL=1
MQHPDKNVKPEFSTSCQQVVDNPNSGLADELIASAGFLGIPIDAGCVPAHDFVAAGKAMVTEAVLAVLLGALDHHDYRLAADAILSHPRSVSFPRLSVALLEATGAGVGPVPPEIAIAVRTAAKAVLGHGRV